MNINILMSLVTLSAAIVDFYCFVISTGWWVPVFFILGSICTIFAYGNYLCYLDYVSKNQKED